jgi:hypothetical protein
MDVDPKMVEKIMAALALCDNWEETSAAIASLCEQAIEDARARRAAQGRAEGDVSNSTPEARKRITLGAPQDFGEVRLGGTAALGPSRTPANTALPGDSGEAALSKDVTSWEDQEIGGGRFADEPKDSK